MRDIRGATRFRSFAHRGFISLAVLALAALLSACGTPAGPVSITSIDLSDAVAVGVTNGSLGSSALAPLQTDEYGTLLKVKSDGSVSIAEAEYSDGSFGAVQSARVHDVNANWLVVQESSGAYAVQKASGDLYRLDPYPFSDLWGERFWNRSPYRTDAAGAIYYPGENRAPEQPIASVYRVEIDAAGNVHSERVTPNGEHVSSYAVSADGVVVYSGTQSRVVLSSGRLVNVPNGIEQVWTAPDGDVYYNSSNQVDIWKVEVSPDEQVSFVEQAPFPKQGPFSLFYFLEEVDGRLFKIERNESNEQLVVEMYDPNGPPSLVEGLVLTSVKATASTSTTLLLAGTDANALPRLLEMDVRDRSVREWLEPNEYDIYEILGVGTGEIVFAAIRLIDGARVIATVDSSRTVSVLETETTHDVRTLVPIQ